MAKEKRKLDRSQVFGTVFGSGNAAYEQHGILFDVSGEELPGFEDVEIPEESPVVAGDNAGLKAQVQDLLAVNTRLQAELGKMRQALADAESNAEAQAEEIQGQLDTANVEIDRLNKQIEELTKPANPEDGNRVNTDKQPAGKSKDKKAAEVDSQLALQTGGAQ